MATDTLRIAMLASALSPSRLRLRIAMGHFLVVEIAHRAKGGPPRHLHHHQDEWFHVIEGEYIVEIGEERYRLGPGELGLRTPWSTTPAGST